MKPLVVILGIFVAAAAGAAGGMLAAPSAAPAPLTTELGTAPSVAAASSAATAPVRVESAGLAEQVHQLSSEVARLQSDLAAIREGRVREPAVSAPKVDAAESIADDEFAAMHRNAILRVIDEDRALQAKKAEDERRAKDAENALARAERNGRELGLTTTQTRSLADFYVLEADKRNEFFKDFRNGNMPNVDREQARTAFAEYRDWRTTELTTRIGADNLARLNEIDGERGPGFAGRNFGGGGGGGADGAGTPGGGGNGNRRRNNGGANPNGGGNNGAPQNPGTNPGGF